MQRHLGDFTSHGHMLRQEPQTGKNGLDLQLPDGQIERAGLEETEPQSWLLLCSAPTSVHVPRILGPVAGDECH